MVVKGNDGTLWSALSGTAIHGPQKGKQLTRIPSLVTNWSYWLMLHPESTTYDLFDGKKYASTPLPKAMSKEASESLKRIDDRLPADTLILGVEFAKARRAYPLPTDKTRACFLDEIDGEAVAVFWYGNTKTAVAFSRNIDGRKLSFYADEISPSPLLSRTRKRGLAGRWLAVESMGRCVGTN